MGPLNDRSFMTSGKYTGIRMANVPAEYLIWVYENKKCRADVAEYVKDNLDVLRKQAEENKPPKEDDFVRPSSFKRNSTWTDNWKDKK